VPFEVCSILDDLRREHGVTDNVRIILSVPVEFPFGGPPVAKFFKQSLKEQGIEYWPNHAVTQIEASPKTNGSVVSFNVSGGESSKSTPVDLLLCTFPQGAPAFCQPLCNPKGFIVVDLQTNAVTSMPGGNVYAIGDACHTTFPKPNKPHPKAGEFAFMMGVHVGHQIAAAHSGQEAPLPPAREASCVAECGVGGKGVNIMPNFTAVLADPAQGMPKFQFPAVENASIEKKAWINGYLTKFFGEGNYETFTSSDCR
jgi:NADH dehydrogenase FAD-containing subunit